MLSRLFSWIAGPSARSCKPRRTRKTCAAGVIGGARVRKRPSAKIAQGMRDELNLLPAGHAKAFGVAAMNAAAAAAAPRRVKPIDEPVEALYNAWVSSRGHKTMKLYQKVGKSGKPKRPFNRWLVRIVHGLEEEGRHSVDRGVSLEKRRLRDEQLQCRFWCLARRSHFSQAFAP